MRSAVYFARPAVFISLLAFLLIMSGCRSRVLPSTNVPPTRENKKVVTFLEQYKSAVEKRSVDAIMELVAKDFSDNMGSEDPALHLDYLHLKERLQKTMPLILDLRLGLFVQHIGKIEDNLIEAVFYFNKQSLMEVSSGEKWVSVKEVNRMILRHRKDSKSPYEFEIVSGI